MNARIYQIEACAAILEEFKTVDSTLVVMPTGTGKTVLAAMVIQAMQPARVMFIAHRDTLIFQGKRTIEEFTALGCQIEMASSTVDNELWTKADVILSTVQTQISGCDGKGRMTKFNPMDFGLLILDEAHHYTSAGWAKVVEYYKQNPNLKILGITATPDRADEVALGKIFKTVAFDYEIQDAIADGWLVPIDQQMVKIQDLDYSNVKTIAGDLALSDVANIQEREEICQGIVGASIEIIGTKRAIMFTASVKQAEMSCAIFNRHRDKMAEWVCDKTDKAERQRILKDFSAGKIQVVCNCGILTEGFDDVGVEVILMGRPTKSRSLYAQMIGRATRPLKGCVDGWDTAGERKLSIERSLKPSCLVVDFTGNSGKHKLVTSAEILGGKFDDETIAMATKKVKESKVPVRMSDALYEAQEKRRLEAEARALEDELRKARLVAQVKYISKKVNPFDVFGFEPERARGWDSGKTLSEPQRNILRRNDIDPDSFPYNEGRQILNEIFKRWKEGKCTYKQAKLLKRYGKPTDCTMQEASNMIDQIAKEQGWKKRE